MKAFMCCLVFAFGCSNVTVSRTVKLPNGNETTVEGRLWAGDAVVGAKVLGDQDGAVVAENNRHAETNSRQDSENTENTGLRAKCAAKERTRVDARGAAGAFGGVSAAQLLRGTPRTIPLPGGAGNGSASSERVVPLTSGDCANGGALGTRMDRAEKNIGTLRDVTSNINRAVERKGRR